MAQEGSSPVSYLENTFILHLLLQWTSCCKGAGGRQRPAKQLKQANSGTCASCQMSRHHRHCCRRRSGAASPLLISEHSGRGWLHREWWGRGLKCRVINLSTCTHSTSRSTTADSLLSATCTNHAPMRETRNKHKDRIFFLGRSPLRSVWDRLIRQCNVSQRWQQGSHSRLERQCLRDERKNPLTAFITVTQMCKSRSRIIKRQSIKGFFWLVDPLKARTSVQGHSLTQRSSQANLGLWKIKVLYLQVLFIKGLRCNSLANGFLSIMWN